MANLIIRSSNYLSKNVNLINKKTSARLLVDMQSSTKKLPRKSLILTELARESALDALFEKLRLELYSEALSKRALGAC